MLLNRDSRTREIGSRVLFAANVLGSNRRPSSFGQRPGESLV